MEDAEKNAVTRALEIFNTELSFEQVTEMFRKLENKKWPFARACIILQSALRCGECESNTEFKHDIEIALLCSSVETLTESHSQLTFKDWLIQNKLEYLVIKNEKELTRSLNQAYQEYVDSEPEREGAFYNFRNFLSENCPIELRKTPITVYDEEKKDFIPASFQESTDYVYAKFRSFFLHRGIGRATLHPPKGFENTLMYEEFLADSYRKRAYRFNKRNLIRWFENVIKESLMQFLLKKNA